MISVVAEKYIQIPSEGLRTKILKDDGPKKGEILSIDSRKIWYLCRTWIWLESETEASEI